jgi:hypothetical protein
MSPMRLMTATLVFVVTLAGHFHAGGRPDLFIEVSARSPVKAAQNAALTIRTRCYELSADAVRGVAEGSVNGQPRTIPLVIVQVPGSNVYTVRQQWPAEGEWVLTFTLGERSVATAKARLRYDGGPIPQASVTKSFASPL